MTIEEIKAFIIQKINAFTARGMKFEDMRDVLNAIVDFEESLLEELMGLGETLSLEATQLLVKQALESILAKVNDSIKVYADSLPLPTGAAAEATQAAAKAVLDAILNQLAVAGIVGTVVAHQGGSWTVAVNNNTDPSTGAKQDAQTAKLGDIYLRQGNYAQKAMVQPEGPVLDMAGRLRVSEIQNQIDIKHYFDKLPNLVHELTNGTATSVWANSMVAMSVSTNGDYVIRQTYQHANYQCGKPLNGVFTFRRFDPQTNVTKRFGMHFNSIASPYSTGMDGVFLESSAGTVSINIYNNGTLTLSVPYTAWDDPLNGAGASGATVDWAQMQLVRISQLWLGVKGVELYMTFGGREYLVHTVYVMNQAGYTQPYTGTPNGPLRWSVRTTGGAGTFSVICATVYQDGGTSPIGAEYSINSGNSSITAAAAGTTYAMLGIRLAAARRQASIFIDNWKAYNSAGQAARVDLLLNPTVANTFNYSALTNTSLEYAVGGATNTVTGGTLLGNSEYLEKSLSARMDVSQFRSLGSSINGTMDTIVLCVTPITGNNIAWWALMNLKEAV